MRSYVSIFAILVFITNIIGSLPQAQADDFRLPVPGVMVGLSPQFSPPILKGIKVHPDNPFKFDFILDHGDNKLSNDALKDESSKLIKYFLASLTIPEKDLWVNLSPYEKDRIIPNSFGLTEMGRDLLAEDYMLKQITASLIYPEGETGKKFWKRIYEEADKKFGTTNIPVNTFNKVWIVPEKAVVYENAKAGTAYVVESRLKVMLEQDYLSLQKHEGVQSAPQVKCTNPLGTQIVREIVIPELTKEVNSGKNFYQLRQVYNSLILATWYKKRIKDSILLQVYENKNKIAGVNTDDPQEKQKIYERYLQAFKKGVFNYIKEEVNPALANKEQEMLPRKYFSGGVNYAMFGNKTDAAMSIKEFDSNDHLPEGIGDDAVNEDVLRITISAADTTMTLKILKELLAGLTPAIADKLENVPAGTRTKIEKLRGSFPRLISIITKNRLKVNDSLIDQMESVYGISQTDPVGVYEKLVDEQIYGFFYYGMAGKNILQAEALSKEYINDCIALMLPKPTGAAPYINPFGLQNGKEISREGMLKVLKDGFNSMIENEKEIIVENVKQVEKEKRMKREQEILKIKQEQREEKRQAELLKGGQKAVPSGTGKKKEKREEIRSVFIPQEDRLIIMALNAKTTREFIENVRKMNGNKNFLPGIVEAELVKHAQSKGWQILDEYFMFLKEGEKSGPKDAVVPILEKPSSDVNPSNAKVLGNEEGNLRKNLTIPITSPYLNLDSQGFEVSMMPQSVWMNKDIFWDKKTGSLNQEAFDWVVHNSKKIFRSQNEYKPWASGIYRFVFVPKGYRKHQVYVRLLIGEKKIIFVGFMPLSTAHVNDQNPLKIELKRYLIGLSDIKTYEDFKKKGSVEILEPDRAVSSDEYRYSPRRIWRAFNLEQLWSDDLWKNGNETAIEKIDQVLEGINKFYASKGVAIAAYDNWIDAIINNSKYFIPKYFFAEDLPRTYIFLERIWHYFPQLGIVSLDLVLKHIKSFFPEDFYEHNHIVVDSLFLDQQLSMAQRKFGGENEFMEFIKNTADRKRAVSVIGNLILIRPEYSAHLFRNNPASIKNILEYVLITYKDIEETIDPKELSYILSQVVNWKYSDQNLRDEIRSIVKEIREKYGISEDGPQSNIYMQSKEKIPNIQKAYQIMLRYWKARGALTNGFSEKYLEDVRFVANNMTGMRPIDNVNAITPKDFGKMFIVYCKGRKDPEVMFMMDFSDKSGPTPYFTGLDGVSESNMEREHNRNLLSIRFHSKEFVEETLDIEKLYVVDNMNNSVIDKMLSDPAMNNMKNERGGIDLTPLSTALQSQRSGEGIKFHLDPAMLAQLQNAPGFVPVIISIQPMINLRQFLGLTDSQSTQHVV